MKDIPKSAKETDCTDKEPAMAVAPKKGQVVPKEESTMEPNPILEAKKEELKQAIDTLRKLKQHNKDMVKMVMDKQYKVEILHFKNHNVKKQITEILEERFSKHEKFEANPEEMDEEQKKKDEVVKLKEDEEKVEVDEKKEEEDYIDLLLDPNFNAVNYENAKKAAAEQKRKEEQQRKKKELALQQQQQSIHSQPPSDVVLEESDLGIKEIKEELTERFNKMIGVITDKKLKKRAKKAVKAMSKNVMRLHQV